MIRRMPCERSNSLSLRWACPLSKALNGGAAIHSRELALLLPLPVSRERAGVRVIWTLWHGPGTQGLCHMLLMLTCLLATAAVHGEGRLERDQIDPHWFAHNTCFWYRVDLGDGRREFVLVDAGKGTRHPAFDHSRVAAELTRLMGKNVAPDRLPIDALDFESDPGAIILEGRHEGWELNLATLAIRPRREQRLRNLHCRRSTNRLPV